MTTLNAKTARFVQVLQTIGCYFISLVLIAFAVSKFFDAQFQIYHHAGHMPLNDISPMTHAWSFFGRSYPYNLFLGIVEFLAGVFILFRRTRLLGLLIALGIYSNILIIDIEFQVYDALTHVVVEFFVVLLLLLPYVKDLATFFWRNMGRIHPTQTTAPQKMDDVHALDFSRSDLRWPADRNEYGTFYPRQSIGRIQRGCIAAEQRHGGVDCGKVYKRTDGIF